jgi:hypothetical protein
MAFPLFRRLPRGLKLVMAGLLVWLVATVPLAVYLVLARVLDQRGIGPGLAGVFAFALNVVAVVLVTGGVLTWLVDQLRGRPTGGGR